jgi:hypothetical protein
MVVMAGGAIVEILAGDSKTEVDAWIGNFNLFNTVVRDPDGNTSQTLNALVRREYSYVVDLSNMKILNVYVGTTDGTKPNGVSSSLHEAMDQVLSLVGAKGG